MKAAAFNATIAKTYGVPVEKVTIFARLLKENGLMTTGARGKNAPEMTPLDASRMTIALLATESPSECVERVRRFGMMERQPETAGHPSFQGRTFEQALSDLFAAPAAMGVQNAIVFLVDTIREVRLMPFHVKAEIDTWTSSEQSPREVLTTAFKGPRMVKVGDQWQPPDGFGFIHGGLRTQRSIGSSAFIDIGLSLMDGE